MNWMLLHPKYWPTWIALSALRLLSLLPYRLQMWLGRCVGALLVRLPLTFVRTARRNLELCFPQQTPEWRRRVLHEHFRSLGMSLFETGISWWGSDERIRALTQVQGEEHLNAALERGQGALLLSAHFTPLEIGCRTLCARRPLSIMYRPTRNLVLERFLSRNRSRHAKRAIPRDDIRTLVTALKSNEPVWYAPDQSYRKKGAQMVPFFGIPAATNTATSRLARMTGAAVLPYFPERLPQDRGYKVTILPMLENFPSDDPVADAKRVNELIEAHVHHVPEQYLWIHRRFKGLSAEHPEHYRN